ncbi:hypothetical protein KFK09_007705 [Dendrobium nobile]|uniref:RING-type E3 ubiquitin transferase n=1 Tax=Dendrobium nobile TaxID=94219 RepID=A0A8T3BXV9_DENNO|nr:hypothetical protein KFK09_007705 [Dendrobium nobile]
MANIENQQGWLPVENSRDCSLGFCTIDCPQWCYVLFPPPPPPFSLTNSFNNHATAFSPMSIAIIGIFATFFLLVTYYTIVTNFCGSFCFHLNHSHHRSTPNGNFEEEESASGGENYHQESWYLPPSNGLDEALIRKITVCKYKRGEGLVEGTECSVCLSEFIEGEYLRLLPKCSHAFHLHCIDIWLRSHSNCPLCRVNILLPSLALEDDIRGENRAASAAENEQEAVVIVVRDLELGRSEDEEKENMIKDFEAIKKEKDRHRFVAAGPSRRGRGERVKVKNGRSRGLHSVMSPVRMKRSVSSGRTWFVRKGKGRALLLPVEGNTSTG